MGASVDLAIAPYGLSMPDGPSIARSFRTLEDVEAALDGERMSFEECMECVDLCVREEAWELRHRAAQRAVDLALVHQRIRAPNLVAAATQVVLAFLQRATGLNEVEERAEEGQRWLTSSSEDLSDRDDEDRSVTRFLSETERQLQWLVHLVNDPTVGSLVRLSSLLRKWAERSDLAVEAGESAVAIDPDDLAARTTLGAGFADLGEYSKAREHLSHALRLNPEHRHALTSLSRVAQECGELPQALELAERAFELDQLSLYSAHRLAAAAAATGEDELLQAALEKISAGVESHGGMREDGWLELLAAEVLADVGRLDDALAAARQLASQSDLPADIGRRCGRLITRIRKKLRQRQQRLDFDNGGGNPSE